MRTDRTSEVQLHIDWTRCDGRGLCTELLPEILARDEWGYPLSAIPDPVVPSTSLGNARKAVELCPRMALSMNSPDRMTP
ncbi:ferredoxin [Rhodococcoides fascians]|uniref:ferredoxin n=1 Tax=Rhodococcoides fascians TaxID=1828 RepID=UPI000B9C5C62|nr:ferredoxin [Rhodococcus fascians]OZE86809.1 ferredoxin [Rhodococcus fascians]OZF13508.1 ferredoxin [Rhodococcus fascians]OZF16298.1 ferredoxin [Rhodococcus fascians]OZF62968.1 ferredoxin [Rhodococcus fascians]OZF66487.1 ferredoxin [Rhodococcus fascians]